MTTEPRSLYLSRSNESIRKEVGYAVDVAGYDRNNAKIEEDVKTTTI